MKFSPRAAVRILGLAAALCLHVSLLAQTPATPATPAAVASGKAVPAPTVAPVVAPGNRTVTVKTELDLPRLKSKGKAGEPVPVAQSKVTVDELRPQEAGGGRFATKQNLVYLTLDAGKTCTRPLRGNPNEITFVSFLAYGSVGTVLDIGGAKLAIKAGKKPGYAEFALINSAPAPARTIAPGAVGPTAAFTTQIKLETHDGVQLAALPVLTVRLDPTAGVWDLFVFQKMVAEDVPLPAANGPRQFSLQPGAQGAWLLNLTMSDENPLCVDANRNGIDDAFEQIKQKGVLLAANAPAADRKKLATEWKSNPAVAGAQPWKIRRPVPDAAVAGTPGR